MTNVCDGNMLKRFLFFSCFIISACCFVNCINSMYGQPATIVRCPTSFCKKYTGETGIEQLSCDDTGDCLRFLDRSFIQSVQIYACMSGFTTRKTCCCNYDFCNSSNHKSLATVILIVSIMFHFASHNHFFF